MYFSSRFDLCAHYFSRLGNFESEFQTEQQQSTLIRLAIATHAETLEWVLPTPSHLYIKCTHTVSSTCSSFRLFHEAFEPIVLIQAEQSTFLLPLSMFAVVINPYTQLYPILFVVVLELLLFCICGEMISDKAAAIPENIFGSQWYNLMNERDKRLLIVCLRRAQEPCLIAYSKMSPFNMQNFSEIVNLSYRLFTCLMKVVD